MTSQLSEMDTIRRSLCDLETQQNKVRRRYEEEISRLRAEIATLRQGLPATTHTVSSLSLPGIFGLSSPGSGDPRGIPGPAAVTDSFLRSRDREQTPSEHGTTLPDYEPNHRDKSRERREVDCVRVLDIPKQLQSESVRKGMAVLYHLISLITPSFHR